MQESDMRQIEAIKMQTYGVEIEMNEITRSRAAQVASDYFGTHEFRDTRRTNGYGTWSAWDAHGREWKFSSDSSICGPADEQCEMVTPILKYEDIELLQGLLRVLRENGAKSTPSRICGIHIHVGLKGLDGRDHDAHTLRNLVNLMAAHERQIGKAIHINQTRVMRYCRPVSPEFLSQVNEKKPETMEELADIWYRSQDCYYGRTSHYNDSRYHMLNLHPGLSYVLGSTDHAKPTVEFRLFQFRDLYIDNKGEFKEGGIHAGEIKAYIQLCLGMSAFAKTHKWVSNKPQQTENEKFAMRTWLKQMSFLGDEFSTARKILMRNLEGSATWRSGRPAQNAETEDETSPNTTDLYAS